MLPNRPECSLLLSLLVLPACPGGNDSGELVEDHSTTNADDGSTSDADTSGDPPAEPTDGDASSGGADETGPGTSDCDDQMILDLGLVGGLVSEGEVSSTTSAQGWASMVDATAGGIMDAPTNPWIYLRFTPEGLRKVEVDDLQALESTDWDIAAKRFGLRLNGGVSGPSQVSAVALEGMTYEDVTELPPGAELAQESFYDADCTLIDDGSGQGAPAYLLAQWWTYPGCVATTGVPFILQLDDGSLVKLVVDAYYESGQDQCNETGMMGMGSAQLTWRWAYLE
ncbi:MAG: HmuY family protein [Myxococcales bacterium]|nr:HmuY family protein [Myxococcales bacterium]